MDLEFWLRKLRLSQEKEAKPRFIRGNGRADLLARSEEPQGSKGSAKFVRPDDLGDGLFIEPRAKDQGVIVFAKIETSKSTGRRYVQIEVYFGEGQTNLWVTLDRLSYTSYVIRKDLGRTPDDEEANVEALLGSVVKIQYRLERIFGQEHTVVVPRVIKVD